MTIHRVFNDSQPVASLAYPHLMASQRKLALEAGTLVAVGDARAALTRGTSSTVPAAACELARTSARRRDLSRALASWDDTIHRYATRNYGPRKPTWLVPTTRVRAMERGVLTAGTSTRILDAGRLGRRILASEFPVEQWLPLLSLEAVLALRTLRSGDENKLVEALFRGCARTGVRADRPWGDAFPVRLQALPAVWLYQFAPARRTETLLARLKLGGLTNLGHLILLQPTIMKIVRKHPPADWTVLHKCLHAPTA